MQRSTKDAVNLPPTTQTPELMPSKLSQKIPMRHQGSTLTHQMPSTLAPTMQMLCHTSTPTQTMPSTPSQKMLMRHHTSTPAQEMMSTPTRMMPMCHHTSTPAQLMLMSLFNATPAKWMMTYLLTLHLLCNKLMLRTYPSN
jgi:hypothetical protein